VAKSRQVTRRTFLQSVVPLPLVLAVTAQPDVPRRVKFGLVSDVHRDVGSRRLAYPGSTRLIRERVLLSREKVEES
jgi:hypothetical protein